IIITQPRFKKDFHLKGIKDNKIEIVPAGVNTEKFKPAISSSLLDKPKRLAKISLRRIIAQERASDVNTKVVSPVKK
ncbi:MAG: hypothetical protein ACTSV7_13515, partial [Candidatus Baldrarchaeia archaeon]